MKRRTFIRSVATASLGMHLAAESGIGAAPVEEPRNRSGARDAFALDANRVRFFHSAIHEPLRVMVLADTHLFRDDERGADYRQFSQRMAGAYHQTRHFRTGKPTRLSWPRSAGTMD